MTGTADLIARLRGQGVVFTINPGPPEKLAWTTPVGVMTPEVLDALRACKADVLVLLKAEQATPVTPAATTPMPCYSCGCTRFWSAGHDHWICGTCHPPAPGVLRDGVQWRVGRPAEK